MVQVQYQTKKSYWNPLVPYQDNKTQWATKVKGCYFSYFLSEMLTEWKLLDSLYNIHIFNTAASNNWNFLTQFEGRG